jgi:glycerol-3-phosphate acyltransferase PlsX
MIAIDAMGGDFAPQAVVEGVLSCMKNNIQSGIKVCMFGPEKIVSDLLSKLDPDWQKYNIVIQDTSELIGMNDEPVQAFKVKKNSSLVRAVKAVAVGDCKAVVSAGNSGAMAVASLFLIGRNKGVDRPALVGLFPVEKGYVVCLDLGANADCKANNLYQFAQLGSKYARDMLKIDNPIVGLLSNGHEVSKGSALTKEAFEVLNDAKINFFGNVEPHHVFSGKVDVAISDGFVGNIFLKTFEATAGACYSILQGRDDIKKELKKRLSLSKQGGALLIGVKKPVLIVHGNASAKIIENSILFVTKIISEVDVENYKVVPC